MKCSILDEKNSVRPGSIQNSRRGGGGGVVLTCRSSGLECHPRGARGGRGVCTGAVAIRKAYERYEIKGVNFLYDAALCLTW